MAEVAGEVSGEVIPVVAGWEAIVPELAPVVTVSVQVVERECPIKPENHVTT